VNGHHWQLALREWVEHLNQRTVFIILFGVALVLGVSGPFGTSETIQLLPRLLYWAGSCIATYGIGSYAAFFAQQVYPHQTGARQATAILFGTLAITIFLFIFNGLFSMRLPETALDMLTLFAQTGLIVATVNGVLAFYNNNKKSLQPTETVRILQRLPIEKRGELISMTVMDHYVEVTTTRGKHLILMRFKDAIAEIPPQLGLQIHRSYWVASDQVQAHRRDGKQLLLITTAQDALPVSRRYQKAVLMAGLLPI
jgi:hypothetical protein